MRFQMELQQIRTEIERKITEKEEEIDNLRYQLFKITQRCINMMKKE